MWLTALIVAAGSLGVQAVQRAPSPDAPALRFHHVHVRVPEPAASMGALARRMNAPRVILQGLGVGVRLDAGYVLFDRLDGPAAPENAPAPARYDQAAAWLMARGAAVTPDRLPPDLVAALDGSAIVDHIAFAVAEPSAVAAALRATPVRRSDEAVAFATDAGTLVEIVRDTDRPDAFWCPMHLDVRSAGTGRCAVCGMDLVPIPPIRPGEYRLDLDAITIVTTHAPAGTAPRLGALQLRVVDPDGEPVTRLMTVHERPFHLFLVGRSLEYFAHVHPEPIAGQQGAWEVAFDAGQAPPPGAYVAFADVLPYGGTTQMLHRAFATPGYSGRLFQTAPALSPGPPDVVADGVRVRVDAELAARRAGRLAFTFTDARTGAPVTDLEPFLGAPAHLLIVNPDLTVAIHGHPEEPAARGPAVTFEPLLPSPGVYKLWVQFQRRGRVSTAAFVVPAR